MGKHNFFFFFLYVNLYTVYFYTAQLLIWNLFTQNLGELSINLIKGTTEVENPYFLI